MSLLNPFSWPLSLPPLLSTSLNVGVAIGGYTMAIPFYAPGIPGAMISLWFQRFFLPGFVSVMVLGVTTLVTGVRAWRGLGSSASRQAALGLLFTFVHFGFGPLIMGCMERMLADAGVAHGEMRWWIQLHVTRTLVADVPACLCFLSALLRERL
ncbi:hypothetical protein LAWI1_G001593 [Lachnellula willkommii]|uniref:Integral membrane protein n=1 Tax=Lachnellula willkommii TaxID=215461 RepID=A0A559MJH0_9HELO|nr:hypothetical protein LAWI1_G001593 [Lachnellula willkommii]